MNIFKRIAALFKRSPACEVSAAPESYDLKVRILKNAGYSFDNHLIGNVYPARKVGNHYDVWAPAIAASIPEGGHHNMEHVRTGGSTRGCSDVHWCFSPHHLEVLK